MHFRQTGVHSKLCRYICTYKVGTLLGISPIVACTKHMECVWKGNSLTFPTLYTHSCPLVAVKDVKHFPVEGDLDAKVQILPVPGLSKLILGQLLALDQLALWNATTHTP